MPCSFVHQPVLSLDTIPLIRIVTVSIICTVSSCTHARTAALASWCGGGPGCNTTVVLVALFILIGSTWVIAGVGWRPHTHTMRELVMLFITLLLARVVAAAIWAVLSKAHKARAVRANKLGHLSKIFLWREEGGELVEKRTSHRITSQPVFPTLSVCEHTNIIGENGENVAVATDLIVAWVDAYKLLLPWCSQVCNSLLANTTQILPHWRLQQIVTHRVVNTEMANPPEIHVQEAAAVLGAVHVKPNNLSPLSVQLLARIHVAVRGHQRLKLLRGSKLECDQTAPQRAHAALRSASRCELCRVCSKISILFFTVVRRGHESTSIEPLK